MSGIHDVVVVGAGPAGLSAAYTLRRQGLQPLVLEQTPAVGDVWRNHYDGLRLNTGRYFSRLPGSIIPRSKGAWPERDDVVRMLESFPQRGGFQVHTGVEVTRIAYESTEQLWKIEAAAGEPVFARAVVLAVGASRVPVVPEWPGLSTFTGQVLHSSKFKSALQYKGKRVLVVGSGNSGAEIASRLSQHAEVVLSVRTPPYILPKSVYGIPLPAIGVVLRRLPRALGDRVLAFLQRRFVGDLSPYGVPLPIGSLSEQFSKTHVTPTLYTPIAADIRAGRVKVVGSVKRFEQDTVHVAPSVTAPNGPTVTFKPDLIVAATGFRPGLADLVQVPGVTLPTDWPRSGFTGAQVALPGLHVIGQVNPLSGQLREIRLEAYRVARSVKRQLKSRGASKEEAFVSRADTMSITADGRERSAS